MERFWLASTAQFDYSNGPVTKIFVWNAVILITLLLYMLKQKVPPRMLTRTFDI